MRYLTAAAFLLTIPLANWMIGNVGTTCVPGGPCLVPVWPGILAPSGVLAIGAALVLRDAVHEHLGPRVALALIFAGAVLSTLVAPLELAAASGVAFLFSELANHFVYIPLRRRGLSIAVFGSSAAGAVVDSALFLFIAFGSLEFLAGQVIGKAWAAVFAVAFLTARARLHAARRSSP